MATRFPITVSGVLTRAGLREHVVRRLERGLGPFGARIERVVVRCSDVNGPRGGVDQVCRIEVAMRAAPRTVVEKRAATPREAFDRCATAARRAVRRAQERRPRREPHRGRKTAVPAAAQPPARRAPPAPEEGSLIGRRVGRSAERLRRVAERPEKRRRDVWVDTAQPGTSASDRKVGAGSTARRNTKLNLSGMTSMLEDSAQSRPSRKSTRRSAGRAKRDTGLRQRAVRRSQAPGARARKARSRRPRRP